MNNEDYIKELEAKIGILEDELQVSRRLCKYFENKPELCKFKYNIILSSIDKTGAMKELKITFIRSALQKLIKEYKEKGFVNGVLKNRFITLSIDKNKKEYDNAEWKWAFIYIEVELVNNDDIIRSQKLEIMLSDIHGTKNRSNFGTVLRGWAK